MDAGVTCFFFLFFLFFFSRNVSNLNPLVVWLGVFLVLFIYFFRLFYFFLTLCILFGIGGGGLKFLLVRCRRVRITVFGVAL